ncbi:MAG: 50S ribosome-binding GTPase [Candidatus Bathyarchaeota archaeon]|nr:MAG: 50S ribosome-binding GTPase [Candidatus Bathyarchaeota archaeon]
MKDEYLVFTGRPNSGKSSIIRAITGLDVASGKRPGTTRRISEYSLSRGLTLVDMPGYGRMTGASRSTEDRTKDEVLEFLESNAGRIALAVHVLDIFTFREVTRRLERKGLISVDVEMILFLGELLEEGPIVAANKVDKADQVEREEALAELKVLIGGESILFFNRIFPVSARTGEGLGELKSAIHGRLVEKGFRTPFKLWVGS